MSISNAKISKKDKSILKFVAQQGNLRKERMSVEQIAKGTNCSVDYIYDKLTNENFRNLFFDVLKSALAIETPSILEKFVSEAQNGSFSHGKLVLELAGMYNESKNVNLKAQVSMDNSPFANKEERTEFLKATLEDFLTEDAEEN